MKLKIEKSILILSLLFLAQCSANNELTKDLIEPPDRDEEEVLEAAMRSYDKELYTISREDWTLLRDGYPASYFVPLAQMKIADSFFETSNYQEAIGAYREFARLYPANDGTTYAMLQVGNSYLEQYKGVANDQSPLSEAIRAFEEVVAKYPSSEVAEKARQKIELCRKKQKEYDIAVGEFYAKQGLEKQAEARHPKH